MGNQGSEGTALAPNCVTGVHCAASHKFSTRPAVTYFLCFRSILSSDRFSLMEKRNTDSLDIAVSEFRVRARLESFVSFKAFSHLAEVFLDNLVTTNYHDNANPNGPAPGMFYG